jgi:hypothetical protein
MDYANYDIAGSATSGSDSAALPCDRPAQRESSGTRNAVVAVVEDGIWIAQEVWAICEFLDIAVVRVPAHCDLRPALRRHAPMAVICELDGAPQDGCHVMKTVASHDPGLPVLLVTGDDEALIGAADAVEELWQLTEVSKVPMLPGIAGLVDFLFQAGRKGNCLRLMPARS